MADVWLGRFSRWVEKLFNAKGGPLLLDIDPAVKCVLSFQSGVEELYLQSVYRYAVIIGIGAVAGQQAAFGVRNPSGSNVIATIELIGAGPSVATVSTFHLSQSAVTPGNDFAGTVKGFRLDARANPQSSMITTFGNVANADLANITFIASGNNSIATGIIDMTQGRPLTLLPGDGIRCVDQTVNEAFSVEMLWRERALETSELT